MSDWHVECFTFICNSSSGPPQIVQMNHRHSLVISVLKKRMNCKSSCTNYLRPYHSNLSPVDIVIEPPSLQWVNFQSTSEEKATMACSLGIFQSSCFINRPCNHSRRAERCSAKHLVIRVSADTHPQRDRKKCEMIANDEMLVNDIDLLRSESSAHSPSKNVEYGRDEHDHDYYDKSVPPRGSEDSHNADEDIDAQREVENLMRMSNQAQVNISPQSVRKPPILRWNARRKGYVCLKLLIFHPHLV